MPQTANIMREPLWIHPWMTNDITRGYLFDLATHDEIP